MISPPPCSADRAPEMDGIGGLTAVAALLAAYESGRLGRAVTMAEMLSGAVSGYQDEIDEALGLAGMSADPAITLAQAHGIRQIALVVRDLEASIRSWWDLLRIGPWNAYTLSPDILQDMHYHGAPARFGLRHAFGFGKDIQIELIEPLEGPSIFADHLASHGEGLHHVGIYVPDHARRWPSSAPRASSRSRARAASA